MPYVCAVVVLEDECLVCVVDVLEDERLMRVLWMF